ncbi:MAG: winged helix-turn-helix transcriptional regulator [Clostridia bacterium]|nr:winged helix-turn-helix transcriptional regulator [Clostridia bacterium]
MNDLKHIPKIAMELHSLSNMNRRFMDNNSHKKMVDSITGTNGWIIGYLDHNSHRDVFQRDLEETFGITRSTVSKVVNLMVQKGLVARSAVEHDARLKKLTLTDKSRELISFMHEDNDKLEKILTDGFSEEEKTQLMEYINRMKNNMKSALDDPDAECFPIPTADKKGRMIK